jgi:hypothetical protein
VTEILKGGQPGLLFLLALLIFCLLVVEQRRDPPRPKMLGCILAFCLINFVSALVISSVGQGQANRQLSLATGYLPAKAAAAPPGFTYTSDYSTFFIDLSDWKPLPKGADKRKQKISPATFMRSDLLHKATNDPDDYVLNPWTTGAGIEAELLRAPGVEIQFRPIATDGERTRYEFIVPIGKQPVGSSWPLSTVFKFWNGFQGEEKEGWRADIHVPTRFVSVSIRFPLEKVVSDVEVFRDDGHGKPESLSKDNPVVMSQDKNGQQFATRSGLDIPGKQFVLVQWKWHPRNSRANAG